MTGRQHLDRQVSFLAVLLGASLALWLILLAMSEIGHVTRYVMATPLVGVVLCAVYHVFMIRCPGCGKRLGHLARSLIDFSLFRFPKRVRFCPYCMTDFDDEVIKRR